MNEENTMQLTDDDVVDVNDTDEINSSNNTNYKCACEFYKARTKSYWLNAVKNWIDVDQDDINDNDESPWTKACNKCGQCCLLACFMSKECSIETTYLQKLFDSIPTKHVTEFAKQPIRFSSASHDKMLPIRYAMYHNYPEPLVERLWRAYPEAASIVEYDIDVNVDGNEIVAPTMNLLTVALFHRYSESFALQIFRGSSTEVLFGIDTDESTNDDSDGVATDTKIDTYHSDYSNNPIYICITEKYQKCVEIFLDTYPDICRSDIRKYMVQYGGLPPPSLAKAVELDFDSNVVLKILNCIGDDFASVSIPCMGLPLHTALHSFHRDDNNKVLMELLKIYPEASKVACPETDLLPLHIAIQKKNADMTLSNEFMIALLDANMDAANVPFPKRLDTSEGIDDEYDSDESMMALLETNLDDVNVPLPFSSDAAKGKSVNDKNGHKIFPLHKVLAGWDSKNFNTEMVLKLIEASSTEVFQTKDVDAGQVPLVLALENNNCVKNSEIVLQILNAFVDATKITDSKDRYPLRIAINNKAPSEVILKLVRQYPDALWLPFRETSTTKTTTKKKDKKKTFTPTDLHEALRAGCYDNDVIEEIASACPSALIHRSKNGKIPLHTALDRNMSSSIVMALLKVEEMHKTNNKQASLRYCSDKTKDMPLHRAIKQNYDKDVLNKLLMMYPCAAMMKNSTGRLPLHIVAAKGGNNCTPEIVQQLIDIYPHALEEKGRGGNIPRDLVQSKLPEASIELICKTRLGPAVSIYNANVTSSVDERTEVTPSEDTTHEKEELKNSGDTLDERDGSSDWDLVDDDEGSSSSK